MRPSLSSFLNYKIIVVCAFSVNTLLTWAYRLFFVDFVNGFYD